MGKDGGEGARLEGRRGERGGAGEGTGKLPVFQQFRKKFEKICGKIWRERIKTFIFASAFALKNRRTINDERLTKRAQGEREDGGVEGSISSLRY